MKLFANFLLIFLLFELQIDGGFGVDIGYVSSDFHIGERNVGDTFVKKHVARVPPGAKKMGIFDAVAHEIVNFTLKSPIHNRITSIELIEQKETKFKASHLGEFEILTGGIGKNSVSMKLSSERGYGFNYKINVYGRS